MHGLINKLTALPGKKDELAKLMLEGIDAMSGCIAYVVSVDTSDPDVIWVTEVWDNKASQDASLTVPAVKSAINKAMPLIAGFEGVATTNPIGGIGL